MLDLFEQYEGRRNLARRTIIDRRRRLSRFEEWLDRDLLDADDASVQGWLDSLPISPASIYTYITILDAFYSWAVRTGYLLTNPVDEVTRPKLPGRLPRPVTLEELRILLLQAAGNPRLAAWIALAAYAGFRMGEIAMLQVPEVDFERKTLFINQGKGGKDAVLPMHTEIEWRLRSLPMPKAGLLFPNPRSHRPLMASSVGSVVGQHMRACGIKKTPHQLRHFFVTEVNERSGGDLRVAQEAARHATPQTTALYAAHSPVRLAVAVQMVGRDPAPGDCPVIGRPCPLGHPDRCGADVGE